jgi:hypothetical protein
MLLLVQLLKLRALGMEEWESPTACCMLNAT